jgi:NAD(P)H-dependent nitrite reductase small subunit
VEFVKVARASDIPERRNKVIHLGNEQIALWHANGRFYAINNVCPHQHIPALHKGILNGDKVTCPMHGWTYSLETGVAEFGDGKVKTYRVKVEGEDIFVEKPMSTW